MYVQVLHIPFILRHARHTYTEFISHENIHTHLNVVNSIILLEHLHKFTHVKHIES